MGRAMSGLFSVFGACVTVYSTQIYWQDNKHSAATGRCSTLGTRQRARVRRQAHNRHVPDRPHALCAAPEGFGWPDGPPSARADLPAAAQAWGNLGQCNRNCAYDHHISNHNNNNYYYLATPKRTSAHYLPVTMNRLFGGRNTGPKPTLNDAIGNVGACRSPPECSSY